MNQGPHKIFTFKKREPINFEKNITVAINGLNRLINQITDSKF